jgi:endoribonuclease LACTB2
MITREQHGDVTLFRFSSWRSRMLGYSVNVFAYRGAVIDTAFPNVRKEYARLLSELSPAGVVLTHQHEDHAGNLDVVARSGLPLSASSLTLQAVRRPEAIGLYRVFCWSPMPAFAAAPPVYEAPGLSLVHLPGHSTDHHVVWDAEREVMFGGDLFLGVKVRVARPMEDPRTLARSARAAAALRPNVYFDSHRGLVPDAVSALEAKAAWLEETIGTIDRRIVEGWTDAAITRDVLGPEEWTAAVSRGDLSKANFVRAVRATAAANR